MHLNYLIFNFIKIKNFKKQMYGVLSILFTYFLLNNRKTKLASTNSGITNNKKKINYSMYIHIFSKKM